MPRACRHCYVRTRLWACMAFPKHYRWGVVLETCVSGRSYVRFHFGHNAFCGRSSPAAIFYLTREGLSVGRATTLTLTTLLLDELFFVIFCPIIVLSIPFGELFGEGGIVLGSVRIVFWTVYSCIVAYTGLLYTGILWKPQAVARGLHKLFSIRVLRRWQPAADRMTGNMVATSERVRHCPRTWWMRVFGATVVSWFSRYLVVNALFGDLSLLPTDCLGFRPSVCGMGGTHGKPDTRRKRCERMAVLKLLRRPYRQCQHGSATCYNMASVLILCLSYSRGIPCSTLFQKE